MCSKKEKVSFLCKLESIEAQLNYIKVQINEINYAITKQNEKHDESLDEQFKKMDLANAQEQQDIINIYKPVHQEFNEFLIRKNNEKALLVDEKNNLLKEQKKIQDALNPAN